MVKVPAVPVTLTVPRVLHTVGLLSKIDNALHVELLVPNLFLALALLNRSVFFHIVEAVLEGDTKALSLRIIEVSCCLRHHE